MISLIIFISIISYLIGSVMFSIILTSKYAGFDIRKRGSGNAGTTNVFRTAGFRIAIITLLCDILKGVIAIGLALLVGSIFRLQMKDKILLIQIASIAVVLGHTFPLFFKFKGGKGVATSIGIVLVLNWKIGLICLCFGLTIILLSRIVSLGSIAAAILFPILTIFIKESYLLKGQYFYYLIFSIILAGIVIFNHRENLVRLINGRENKLFTKKKEG